MVLQPVMDAAAKKNGGGGGKSGSKSSGNSHSNSNNGSNGDNSDNSNGKAKKNLDDTGVSTDLPSAIGETSQEYSTAPQSESNEHVPGILLVKFKEKTGERIKNAVINVLGAKVQDSINEIDLKIIKVPENAIDNVKSALEVLPFVEYVETDSIIAPLVIPNDAVFPDQWHLSMIQAPAAWDINKGKSDVILAVLDSGFEATHPDLADKFLAGYNAYSNNNDWSSAPCGHGTMVAGVAAAMTDNGIGVSGVGWQNKILPIKVTGIECYTTSSILAKGITYAANHGAKVANVSFAIYGGDRTITHAARYMYQHGGLVVAAAGNSGGYENYKDNRYIISVSATARNDLGLASFSSYGKYVDFSAPGISIYTTSLGGLYSNPSGTSVSSPIVAGLLALIFSQNPNATPQQVYDILKNSSVDLGSIGYDQYFGWGRIDAYKALQMSSP